MLRKFSALIFCYCYTYDYAEKEDIETKFEQQI